MTPGGGRRIAVVHSFYTSRNPSGENRVVEAEIGALQHAGFDVELFAARTDDLEADRTYPLRAALRVATGRGASPLEAIRAFGPDVVHVHNLFPNWGRTWVREIDVPVVVTVHNFRPLCINSLLLRDGAVCTACPDGDRWAGVRHGCYHGSRLASVPVAWGIRRGPAGDPLLGRADRVVVLSGRQREMFVAAGLDAAKVEVAGNFLPDAVDPGPAPGDRRGGWLFVGRLMEEKGIVPLLRGWPPGERLTVVGDGPQRAAVEELASGKDVQVLGPRDRGAVLAEMGAATGLVFPSVCFENAPLVYVEALARGLPVVAFPPSTVAEAVEAEGTGAVAGWDDGDLEAALTVVRQGGEGLRARARAAFEDRYTEAAFVERARRRYGEVLAAAERLG